MLIATRVQYGRHMQIAVEFVEAKSFQIRALTASAGPAVRHPLHFGIRGAAA